MPNKILLPKDKELAKQVLDNHLEQQQIEQGLLGKLWGNSSNIPNNIAALSIALLLLTGIAYTLFTINTAPEKISIPIKNFWAIISPISTLAFGYLFGVKKKVQ